MKRSLFILIGGLMLAVAGFVSTYAFATAPQRSAEHNSQPELVWLKQQYQLSDEQYARICELYAAYHPKCVEMCHEIDAQNARLQSLLAKTNVVTPEIKSALADAAQLRAKCEANMMSHFYQVSQVMPSDQGKRYLAWMQKETLIPSPMSENQTTTK